MSRAAYAQNTTVSVEKSQSEVTGILRKYGANRFGTMEDETSAYLMFDFKGLSVQMVVPLPPLSEFMRTDNGRTRSASVAEEARAQAIRQRWRALVLAVKAKLEAVSIGISTVEKEFMAFVMMPDGRQLADHVLPVLGEMVKTGKMPLMLQGPK
jgi:hypothetical protein